MEKHWGSEECHKFYAEHMDLDPAKFTTDELARLYNLHYYRMDLCGDNDRARQILNSGLRSPLEAAQLKWEGEGNFCIRGYLVEFRKDENGDTFGPDSIKGCMDEFMKNPVVTLEFNTSKVIGRVNEYRIDAKGVQVDIVAKAPAGMDVQELKRFVPALGGVLTNRGGDLTVIQRVDQVGLIRPENRIVRKE